MSRGSVGWVATLDYGDEQPWFTGHPGWSIQGGRSYMSPRSWTLVSHELSFSAFSLSLLQSLV